MAMDGFDDQEEHAGRDASSTLTVLRFERKAFAVGLLWTEVDKRDSADVEARQVALRSSVNGDFYVLRAGKTQFGIGRKEDGHLRGMPSLAGALADAIRGSWLGVFEVENCFYVLGVRDDAIMAESDRAYVDESEARTAFEDLYSITDWQKVYAPERFAVDEADSTPLKTLIKGAKAPKLQDVQRVSSLTKYGAFGALVLALLVGGLWYQQKLQDEEIARQTKEALDRAAKMVGVKQPEIEVPPMPWEGKYEGAGLMRSCSASMRRLVVDIPGWRSAKAECDGGFVRMDIERTAPLGDGGGTINWVRYGLDKRGLQRALASPLSPDKVQVTWPVADKDLQIDEPKKWGVEANTAKLADVRRFLQSWFEESFVKIQFPSTENSQFWRTLKFQFETRQDPVNFSSILEKVPGLVVTKVTLDLKKLTYVVEGAAYEQLPIPKNAKRSPNQRP